MIFLFMLYQFFCVWLNQTQKCNLKHKIEVLMDAILLPIRFCSAQMVLELSTAIVQSKQAKLAFKNQFIFSTIDAKFSRNFRMNKFRKSRRKLINAKKKKIHLHFTHCRFFFRTIFRPCRIIIRGWCSTLKSWLKMRFWALIKLFNSTDDFLVEFDGEHFSWIFPWQEYDLVNEDVDISIENEILNGTWKWSDLDAED